MFLSFHWSESLDSLEWNAQLTRVNRSTHWSGTVTSSGSHD
ncbi:MAG: hypothetical protein ACRC8J_06735 [Phocaeicola sp.]